MGGVHGSKYAQMPDVELYCFDPDPEKSRSFCDRFGASPADSLESLFNLVDIVDVCVPNDLHVEVGEKAIAAGRAVLMEKPLAMTAPQAFGLCQAADRAGVPLMTAHVVRYFPEYRRAHELVASGGVGQVGTARLRRGGKAPVGTGGWFQDFGRSGGVLLDLAVHDFDWLRWTLGEVRSVYSQSVALSAGRTGIGDYAVTTLTFESGAIAHVESTWMDPSGFRTTLEVSGTEGMIQHDSRSTWTLRTSTDSGTVQEGPLAPADDPYFLEIRGFLESLSGGSPLPVPPLDAVMAVSISDAAIESAKSGKVVAPTRYL